MSGWKKLIAAPAASGPTIEYLGAVTKSYPSLSSSSHTISNNSFTSLGLQQDDLIISGVSRGPYSSGDTEFNTTGYSAIGPTNYFLASPSSVLCANSGGGNQVLMVHGYKKMSSSPDTNVSFDISSHSYNQYRSYIVWTVAFRGVDTTTPLDASVAYQGDDNFNIPPTYNTSKPTMQSVTTVSANCTIVAIAANAWEHSGNYTLSWTGDTTQAFSLQENPTSYSTSQTSIAVGYYTLPSAGSTTPATLSGTTYNSTNATSISMTIPLRPAT